MIVCLFSFCKQSFIFFRFEGLGGRGFSLNWTGNSNPSTGTTFPVFWCNLIMRFLDSQLLLLLFFHFSSLSINIWLPFGIIFVVKCPVWKKESQLPTLIKMSFAQNHFLVFTQINGDYFLLLLLFSLKLACWGYFFSLIIYDAADINKFLLKCIRKMLFVKV